MNAPPIRPAVATKFVSPRLGIAIPLPVVQPVAEPTGIEIAGEIHRTIGEFGSNAINITARLTRSANIASRIFVLARIGSRHILGPKPPFLLGSPLSVEKLHPLRRSRLVLADAISISHRTHAVAVWSIPGIADLHKLEAGETLRHLKHISPGYLQNSQKSESK